MSHADYLDPLYRELIPQRLTPAPKADDGPTARWATAHPDDTSLADIHQLPVGRTA